MTQAPTLIPKAKPANASAPGRVNLIGEHTDYNGGFVLPSAIPQRAVVALEPRSPGLERKVLLESADMSGPKARFEYELGNERPVRGWPDYVQGITRILADEGFRLGGFRARIQSRVPIGSGLSSSAALEVSMMRALRAAFDLQLEDVQIARLGQRVENEFVGARVGIMDQMAASLAAEGEALFLDTRDLTFRRLKLDPRSMGLLVINSGVSHSLAQGGGYNERRSQCEEACKLLGVRQLRDLDSSKLDEARSRLPELIFKRVQHVVTENERVLDAVSAIESGDSARLGRLFDLSHQSMRDDYEVSVPEIDLLVEIARKAPGVHGARLTGGGFGGSIVVLIDPARCEEAASRITAEYSRRSGQRPTVLVPDLQPALRSFSA